MLDFNFHLTTPRLYISYLDPSKEAHCEFMYALVNTPQMVKEYRGKRDPLQNREAGRKFIQDGVDKLERSGYGRYLISLKPNNIDEEGSEKAKYALPFSKGEQELVGIVTMQLDRFPGAPTIPDIGFGLFEKYQGRGYATEAAQGLMKYFEEERGQFVFSGYCSPDNEASKSVLRNLGFEERGVRSILGIFGEGEETALTALVWTKGVAEDESELKRWGL
ncbi:acyl-CoA N-acyltransferase [Cucurbitaria berberidis CBS 394.84]|uniref:Acyl-CoA N-acyltransferase n=1 Tax=Cucurbitaria berberidis CBS 394.84 TaxID=1168544 RepID=A0A9P4GP09_9PLEO|nr:acyl-CoA N-acyltransferase [Cucurbitaria berberidis CBS 394.84]KAF1848709.1 acyl-CoA N-acyltransferase [Cucurbitaria berberidis CBS 394.84]